MTLESSLAIRWFMPSSSTQPSTNTTSKPRDSRRAVTKPGTSRRSTSRVQSGLRNTYFLLAQNANATDSTHARMFATRISVG